MTHSDQKYSALIVVYGDDITFKMTSILLPDTDYAIDSNIIIEVPTIKGRNSLKYG